MFVYFGRLNPIIQFKLKLAICQMRINRGDLNRWVCYEVFLHERRVGIGGDVPAANLPNRGFAAFKCHCYGN